MELRLIIKGHCVADDEFKDHDLQELGWYERAELIIEIQEKYIEKFKKNNKSIIKNNPYYEIQIVMQSKLNKIKFIEELKIA